MADDHTDKFNNFNVAIFEPYCDFSTNPTLMALTVKLIRLGANIDLYSPGFGNYPGIQLPINQFVFPYRPRLWCYGPKRTWQNWKRYFLTRAWRSHRSLKKIKYDLVLGIDHEGIIAAWEFARKANVPMLYLSFELMFRDELKKFSEVKEKQDEIRCSRQADIIVIQDERRAKLLINENSIDENKIVYLPVSPGYSKPITSDYLRNKFQIPLDKKIVLHSGSFEKWTYPNELINSLQSWPANVLLVIHTRDNPKNRNPYINRLRISKPANLILSTEPLGQVEYEEMVASADIGLILYKPLLQGRVLQKNIEFIGLASGKFSHYMKHGLPVISIRQKCYSELLKKYKFGIDIPDFSLMGESIAKILNNYEQYKSQASRLFLERLDFEANWKPLEKRLTSILSLS